MQKHSHNSIFSLCLLALALLASLPVAQAQSQFTITDGTLRWLNNSSNLPLNRNDFEEVDRSFIRNADDPTSWSSLKESTLSGATFKLVDSTLVTTSGKNYLRLDLSEVGDDASQVDKAKLVMATSFDAYCSWTRSGDIGYYYQEWTIGGTPYAFYLYGDGAGQDLKVSASVVGQPMNRASYWYDWDFGVAMQEDYVSDGTKQQAFYWIQLEGSTWRLSCDSYERPDARIYEADMSDWAYFCHKADNQHEKYGVSLYMPVQRTEYAKDIDFASKPANVGLQEAYLTLVGGGDEQISALTYGQEAQVHTTVNSGTVNVTRGYVHFKEEVDRYGINNYWRTRGDEEVVDGLGVPTYKNYYYWADDADQIDYATQKDAAPTPESNTLQQESVAYSLNNAAKRYLQISSDGVVSFRTMPPSNFTAIVTVTVRYTNGTSESKDITLAVAQNIVSKSPSPTNAPAIGVAVFGGGRMAPVAGDTKVLVHRTDSIPYVYGGNDISGQVSGGSTVVLGSAKSADYQVHIGSVYGGGNGYYIYPSDEKTFSGKVQQWTAEKPAVMGFDRQAITLPSGTTKPDIASTQVKVMRTEVLVDSLFGGARNAYITTNAGARAVSIINESGVVLAEFGGNNVGGTISDGSTIEIDVKGTTLENTTGSQNALGVENGFYTGFGREFGIRHLFGGGNKVEAPVVNIKVEGGMIDTLFAGGNSASVQGTTVDVECGSNAIFTNQTALAYVAGANESTMPTTWVGGRANYNVRCLFGGNNQAAMAVVPTLNLTSGGIGTVYGGGNAGDMVADDVTSLADADALWNEASFLENHRVAKPSKFGTQVLVNSADINIDFLYGGCMKANVLNSTYVHITNGTVGMVFGGCNVSGDVGSTVAGRQGTYVVLDGGTVLTDLYGGADGGYHCSWGTADNNLTDLRYVESAARFADNDKVDYDPYDLYLGLPIPSHNNTNVIMRSGTVCGNMYAGANLANVGFSGPKFTDATGETKSVGSGELRDGTVHLTMRGGTVHGNVYGGGNQANIYGLSYLAVRGTSTIVGSLYAGNDHVGAIQAFGKYTDYAGNTDDAVLASNGMALNHLKQDGGWEYSYSSYTLVDGTPQITAVYGSGNGAYNYGDPNPRPEYGEVIDICQQPNMDNPRPLQKSTFVDINVGKDGSNVPNIDTVFGGGNGVGVEAGVDVVVLLNAKDNDGQYVHTIYGGNNRDNMDAVPDVMLEKGQVFDVYGGCNAGDMIARNDVKAKDMCGNSVRGVSTHVVVNSDEAQINGTLYGGCNQADVYGMTYVDIRKTSPTGIAYVFGGNNISGIVRGNTRVDMSGGLVKNLYGGSNGYYDYEPIADSNYTVYEFGKQGSAANLVATKAKGSPTVACTYVNLWGGTIEENAYGGGRMGDCDTTHVVVDDKANTSTCASATQLEINGTVFGGGEGDWKSLASTHKGNVNGETHVDLYHAKSINKDQAKAYGGGRGGDVYNTYITVHEQWEQPFYEIYGGCWGSNVIGTTHLTMDGREDANMMNARYVYGGNDFTGNVYKATVTINSGRYGDVFGAGNGYYEASDYADKGADGNFSGLTVPNTEYVEVVFNQGIVDSNLYGGGRLGTTFSYRKSDEGRYMRSDGTLTNNAVEAAADSVGVIYTDPEDYSHIIVSVYGGHFMNSIFAGGMGAAGGKQLVYGLKELNMQGGTVERSLYGGSRNVNDGYPGECYVDSDTKHITTTMRPSSILNVSGGTIKTDVYGAGYRGYTFGSAYVNLGKDAIDSCALWQRTVNYQKGVYDKFRPGAKDGYTDALQITDQLLVDGSVYGGADWGENDGSFIFDKDGFYGGESRIRVDGNGYQTSTDPEQSTLNVMHIDKNIIGTGTSVMGGDVLSRIDIYNYGQYISCHPSKKLQSVQRAHVLYLHNTAIEYTGASDALSAYPSAQYTITRVDTVNYLGHNVLELDYTATEIHDMNFYEWDPYQTNGEKVLTKSKDMAVESNVDLCDKQNSQLCDEVSAVTDANRFTTIVVNNGVNIDVRCSEKPAAVSYNSHHHHNHTEGMYGHVKGYGYLLAQEGTNAVVMAASKYGDKNEDDNGFMTTCADTNQIITVQSGWDLTWGAESGDTYNKREYPYYNHGQMYRVWSVGTGYRSRVSVILAHGAPEKLPENKKILVGADASDATNQMALAYGKLELPPTTAGHYYKINGQQGIVIMDDNSSLRLIDRAWDPKISATDSTDASQDGKKHSNWDLYNSSWVGSTLDSNGNWTSKATPGDSVTANKTSEGIDDKYLFGIRNELVKNPETSFGLLMAEGANFKTDGTDKDVRHATVISANPFVSVYGADDRTASVEGDPRVSPILDLFLTYNPNFANTILGTVYFTLDEYYLDDEGNEKNLNMPINVAVTISTVLEDFRDMEFDMLAMYNEGRSNTYTRKAVLPATLEERDLYVRSVRWYPDSCSYANGQTASRFYLVGEDEKILQSGDNNLFRISFEPTDDVSSSLTTAKGWLPNGMLDQDADVLSLVSTDMGATSYSHTSCYDEKNYERDSETGKKLVVATNDGIPITKFGKKLGTLDGRGNAGIDFNLHFDGDKIYPSSQVVGHVILELVSVRSGSDNEGDMRKPFFVKLNVFTREHGDTIYIASADKVKYIAEDGTEKEHTKCTNYAITEGEGSDVIISGKKPSLYVGGFDEALTYIYQLGDVIAIIDEVNVTKGLTIQNKDIFIPVIRYAGHHHEMPGEQNVYRGTMVNVSGPGASLTARNINFIGSSTNKLTPGYGDVDANYSKYYNRLLPASTLEGGIYDPWRRMDTNVAYGPVISVSDGASLTLGSGTVIEENWNNYRGDDDRLKGSAISVTDGGRLYIANNFTVRNNVAYDPNYGQNPDATKYATQSSSTGAIYVEGGEVHINRAGSNTVVDITKNYLDTGFDPTDPVSTTFWKNHLLKKDDTEYPSRYEFDETLMADNKRGNVFLYREPTNKAAATDHEKVMYDRTTNESTHTDVITFYDILPENTKIGVTKWFPGEQVRDTIRFAYLDAGVSYRFETVLQQENFISDEGFNQFYHESVNNQYLFLQRCATFRHQVEYANRSFAEGGLRIEAPTHQVLEYLWREDATCPTGGEQLVYNIQGGFFPYTYNWYSGETASDVTTVARTRKTPYTNSMMDKFFQLGETEQYLEAITDTMVTLPVEMALNEKVRDYYYKVRATDLAGCELGKDIHLELVKTTDPALAALVGYEGAGWSDTNYAVEANRITAEATRNFQAVKITPVVWAKSEDASISVATFTDSDGKEIKDQVVYVEDDANNIHQLDDVLFCAGDHIRLSTRAKDNEVLENSDFIMWDFDPYYNNPADYIVPTQSTTVVAYYGPRKYWIDAINNTTKGQVHYSESQSYTSGYSADQGYVVDYYGDVHIYTRPGLAWFISSVNGINGTQAKTFYFNRVFLHPNQEAGSDGVYDMRDYLWTPVGTAQHPFRGWFLGTENDVYSTTETAAANPVVIRNIIVNEPNATFAGFFGNIDTARIRGIRLESAMVRGSQYVGTLAAASRDAKVENVQVGSFESDMAPGKHVTTILTTRHTGGGLIGNSVKDSVDGSVIETKFVGTSVYVGGVAGVSSSSTITNNVVSHENTERMDGIYYGGAVGYGDGTSSADDTTWYQLVVWTADTNMGTVTGGGAYAAGTSVTITATAAEGYHFVNWGDGNTDNPRTIVLNANITIEATFEADDVQAYTVSAYSANSDMGDVSIKLLQGKSLGDNTYTEGSVLEIKAVAHEGYEFTGWITADGFPYSDTSSTLTINVSEDLELLAQFAEKMVIYTLTLKCNSDEGTLYYKNNENSAFEPYTDPISYYEPFSVIVKASGNVGYHFSQWSNGETDSVLTLNITTTDSTLDAQFAKIGDNEYYSLHVQVAPATAMVGTVTVQPVEGAEGEYNEDEGSYTYPAGTQFTLTAKPAEGFMFGYWEDQSTDNPRYITLNSDMEVLANFVQYTSYTLSLSVTPQDAGIIYQVLDGGDMEQVGSSIELDANTSITLRAMVASENSNYVFSKWSDGVTNAERTITMSGDLALVAEFIVANGVPTPTPNPNGYVVLKGAGSGSGPTYVANNYVRFREARGSDRVGGIVGYSKNTVIENNYVYGHIEGTSANGAVGAVADKGTLASHNYYADGTVDRASGQVRGGAYVSNTTSFSGSGNQVQLAERSYGVSNLTRALNAWVRQQGGQYRTWRSDLEGLNSGYPVFGVPDLIPVFDTLTVSGCDTVYYGGHLYTASAEMSSHVVDSVLMVDSTARLSIIVNHSVGISYSDSAELGSDYAGHGFMFSAAESELLRATVQRYGHASITLSDTLRAMTGCDSIVSLTLTYTLPTTTPIDTVETRKASDIRIYPNPTSSLVTIDVDQLRRVELFDSEGRRLQDYYAQPGTGTLTIDVSTFATGVYYLRVHTFTNITIKKLIKQ